MKRARRAALARRAGFALVLALVARAAPAPASGALAPCAAEDAIRRWSAGPRATARLMIEEYGPPDGASWRELRWYGNGPWAKTVVHHNAWPRLFGARSHDWLEQTVSYLVPIPAVDDVQRFDERIEINRSAAQMSARGPDEATNRLLLNLAYEIAEGKRDVRSAREVAARTGALAKEGKTSIYRERLLFPPRSRKNQGGSHE